MHSEATAQFSNRYNEALKTFDVSKTLN